jgi:hypothetical protein
VIHAGKTQPVVPIGPRSFVELASFRARQDFAKHIIANLGGERLDVRKSPMFMTWAMTRSGMDASSSGVFHQTYLLARGFSAS